jgi:hypothetical protein
MARLGAHAGRRTQPSAASRQCPVRDGVVCPSDTGFESGLACQSERKSVGRTVQTEGVERSTYVHEVERAWARHRYSPALALLVPWPWAGRWLARRTAARLSAVIEDLNRLQPPAADQALIERYYLAPLRFCSMCVSSFATEVHLGESVDETVRALDGLGPIYSDEAHRFVVEYGLPQFWGPRTAAWEPRDSPPTSGAPAGTHE